MSAQPMVGNLAWAPLPAFEEIEVLDRFNGVPTLGIFGNPHDRTLFWRALGYVPPSHEISLWLYVPIAPEEEARLEDADPGDLLTGLVFETDAPRMASVGVAQDNRLVVEFQWMLPTGMSSNEFMGALVANMLKELTAAHKSASAGRKRQIQRARKAVKELAPC